MDGSCARWQSGLSYGGPARPGRTVASAPPACLKRRGASMTDSNAPPFDAASPEALLAQVALSNRAAFESLYRDTSSRLFGICLRVLNERAEAEEVLQEVYTSVWRKAGQFDATRASAMGWLCTMARNKAIDRLRAMPARHTRTALELADEVADPGASLAQQAETLTERARLENCLKQLEPKRHALIRAAFFDGSTYEELAVRTQAPLGSVKSWIRRGLMQLRTCLES
jgi:RNA polymerase sigma-70 factor, ECF subfamily